MTVVLITGNLINQFKCLITMASLRAEHEGSHFDADEIPERGRKEIKSSGDKASLEKSCGGPQKTGVGASWRGLMEDSGRVPKLRPTLGHDCPF